MLHAGARAAPHLLVMTATPIPRTLALTAYGDLDVTILDELPPGREPPATRVLHGQTGRARALKELRAALDAGRQAYLVCPLIEESEKLESADIKLADVTEAADWLRRRARRRRADGRRARAAADGGARRVMRAFRTGELRVLVATTVIEVGVDVPAASMMVIEEPSASAWRSCISCAGASAAAAGARPACSSPARAPATPAIGLGVMAETSDGFHIAEEDLRIRGPGEIFGTRQAGMPRLRFADLVRDAELLRMARAEAFALLEADPQLAAPEHATTRAVLDARWAEARLFGEEAG